MEQNSKLKELVKTTDVGQSFIWLELNLADIVLTVLALSLGFSEGNSFLNLFVHNTGFFVFYRITMSLAVLACLHHFKRTQYLRWLNIGLGLVVLWGAIWLGLYTF